MEGVTEPPIEQNNKHTPEMLPNDVLVTPWHDEVIETVGFGPRSVYTECVWGGILGPTATLMYRRLGSWAEFNADGVNVDLTDLAVSLGLGEGLGQRSLLGKTLKRLVHFDVARWSGPIEVQVRTALPPLPLRHVERLSYTARRLHEEFTRRPGGAERGRSE